MHQLVDDGAGEVVALGGDVLGDGIEEDDLLAVVGLNGKDVGIQRGDVEQGGIEGLGEFVVVLSGIQGGEEVLGLQAGGIRAELHEEHVQYSPLASCAGLLPRFRLGEGGLDAL